MNDWWGALDLAARFYWGVAIFATALQVCLLLAAFLGADHGGGMDDALDVHAGDSGHTVNFFSLRAIVAFLVGFGWAGVLALGKGLPASGAFVAALATGGVFMLVMAGLMAFLMSLRADGTIQYGKAVGVRGKVYVTVPPQRSGTGQVELLLQSRLITANAVTDHAESLAPLSPVEIIAVEADNLFVVQPIPALT